jgi:3-hydroxyisobutyrate dehydrogenase-like beta-hydroxyacid dehydrogenase
MTKVAFLGLGRMGLPMAVNLTRAGHDLAVWNRSTEKADRFAGEHGARAARTPYDAASGADVVITMLADDQALLDAYLGEDGAAGALSAQAKAIDMGTVSPETVARLHSALAERGVDFIDAPVSGSVAAATAGSLTIMAAGEHEAVEECRAILSDLGDPVLYMGESGAGSAMKLAVNSIVHSLNGAVSEALVLAERSGIERTKAYSVFLNSAISAPFVGYRQDAFERPGEIPVGFRMELAAKDLRLALALATKVGADLPQTRTNLELLGKAVEAGFGDVDETGLAQYLREQAADARTSDSNESRTKGF